MTVQWGQEGKIPGGMLFKDATDYEFEIVLNTSDRD
jgi:hypothetical protein